MSTKLTLLDRFRRWSYLQDVDLWLSSLPGSQRRTILRDLRANLGDAASDDGMERAIAALGPARQLAREYLESEPTSRPIWYQGAIAALVLVLLAVTGFAVYSFGMLDALEHSGAGAAQGAFLGVRIEAVARPEEIGVAFHGFSWPTLIGGVLAWALGCRIWRLVRRQGPER